MTTVHFPLDEGVYVWTSPYGYRTDPLGRTSGQSFHGGVDVAPKAPGRKIPIYSPVEGLVTVPGFEAHGAGNNIWVIDSDRILWKVFHLDSVSVHTGQRVRPGETVGIMGTTGASTGAHAHIERWQGGAYGTRTDPTSYLREAEAARRFPRAAPQPPPSAPIEDDEVTLEELQRELMNQDARTKAFIERELMNQDTRTRAYIDAKVLELREVISSR